jgi:hypothetical protein
VWAKHKGRMGKRIVYTEIWRESLAVTDHLRHPEADETNRLTNSVAPEPEGSSPHSQELANGPYPEPGESTPHPPNQSTQDPF